MNKSRIDHYVRLLAALRDRSNNPESAHLNADDYLCAALREAGLGEITDAWEAANNSVGFWYA